MKPILEWLQQLPPGYRERAISQCREENRQKQRPEKWRAIMGFIAWSETTEGFGFWENVKNAILNNTPLPPLPDDGHSGPSCEPETNKHMDYSTTPVARPTLVYGEDVANMNEGRCIQIIKALNAEVKELTDTGVDSVTITKRIAERGAAIAEVVARLDTFAA